MRHSERIFRALIQTEVLEVTSNAEETKSPSDTVIEKAEDIKSSTQTVQEISKIEKSNVILPVEKNKQNKKSSQKKKNPIAE